MARANESIVKIAVIGDSQVGKTSLVIALTNESFPDVCPPVVPPATIPADFTPEGVPFHVIDTSSRPEQRTTFEQTCSTADVIVLLFEAGSKNSLKRVGSYWMPTLKQLGVLAPVVLVASKQDLSRLDNEELIAAAEPIVRKSRQIETCLECSAKQLVNVAEVFYHALKAVVNPMAPLFDAQAENGQGSMTPLCIRALKRIFNINDVDKDGALSDLELNNFQVQCFSAPLQPEELSGVKKVVADQMQRGVNQAGLTLAGFLFLHALFIERGRLETVWAVLRTYGYNNDLRLSDEVLSEVNFNRAPDQVIEMTEACQGFFKHIFHDFDRDKDGLLSRAELAELFSTAPQEPWQGEEYRSILVSSQGRSDGSLTLQGFLSKWAYTTATNPVETLAYLRYLGYRGSATPFFATSKSRKQEIKQEQLHRSVVQVAVFLASKAGEGALLRGLVGREESVDPSTSTKKLAAAGSVSYKGTAKTLILKEQQPEAASQLEKRADSLAAVDVAAFAFDSSSPQSFRTASSLMQSVAHASGNTLPCVLVAVEDETGMNKSLIRECAVVCSDLQIRQPVTLYSENLADVEDVFEAFLLAAEKPDKSLAIPLTASLKAARRQQETLKRVAVWTLGGCASGLLCYAAYKAFQSFQASESRSAASETILSGAPQDSVHSE